MPVVCINRPNRTHKRFWKASSVARVAGAALEDGAISDELIGRVIAASGQTERLSAAVAILTRAEACCRENESIPRGTLALAQEVESDIVEMSLLKAGLTLIFRLNKLILKALAALRRLIDLLKRKPGRPDPETPSSPCGGICDDIARVLQMLRPWLQWALTQAGTSNG